MKALLCQLITGYFQGLLEPKKEGGREKKINGESYLDVVKRCSVGHVIQQQESWERDGSEEDREREEVGESISKC